MTRKKLALAIIASVGLGASIASGGANDVFGFYLSPAGAGHRYAQSTFGDVRSDPDPSAFAECGTNATYGFCSFVKNSEYSGCYTTDPAQLTVIRSMHDGALFSVQWEESTAECTYILQYTSSRTKLKVQ